LRHLTLLGLAALAACAPQPIQVIDGAGDLGEADFKIYGGSGPDAPEHDAVVALHQLSSDGTSVYVSPFCTGTLIEGDVVLTAAHCLDTAGGGGPRFRTLDPSQLAIYVGDDPEVDILDHLYLVSETLINPSYNRRALRDDIALVRLSGAVTEALSPVAGLPSAEGFTSGDAGATLNFAGFGEAEDGSSSVKLQVDGVLGGLGCAVPGCSGGDAATQISYSQSAGAGPCFGDSGGPAFLDRSGTPYVAGITSYGDSGCAIYGVSTRVDAFESWIGDFTGSGSGDGGSGDGGSGDGGDGDGGSGDGGSGDGGAATCGDGVCDPDESCDGRDATAECPDDCPGKTNGRPSGRYCYVGDTCEGAGCP